MSVAAQVHPLDADTKNHYFTIHFDVRYRTPADGLIAQRPHNIIIARDQPTVPMAALRDAEMGAIYQFMDGGVPRENIIFCSYVGISYHGEMSDREFTAGIAASELGGLDGDASQPESASTTTPVPVADNPYDA